MKVVEHFQHTINQIHRYIDEDGNKKITRITNFFWTLHLSMTVVLFYFTLSKQHNVDAIGGTGLVILQLMVTKIFDTMNRLYDNAVTIQSNTVGIKDVIISIIKEYYKVFDMPAITDNEYESCIESIAILDNQIRDDLITYSKNMRTWKIILNSFFWKSPDYTPLLEKDAIKEKLLRILTRMTKFLAKHDGVHDTSPETQSIRVMAF